MALAARALALERFDVGTAARAVAAIYADLLGARTVSMVAR
jgi:hypothetical protein